MNSPKNRENTASPIIRQSRTRPGGMHLSTWRQPVAREGDEIATRRSLTGLLIDSGSAESMVSRWP
nr:hypothetical protein [Rhodopirellula sp. SM50]